MCGRLSNETWFIYTDCRPSTPYFQSKRRLVDRLRDILVDLIGNEQTSSKRDSTPVEKFLNFFLEQLQKMKLH
jgi:hypothetical protein